MQAQNFSGKGFDDDLEDIASEAKADQAQSGFNRHPRGSFQGTVSDIVQKDLSGQPVWEILVQTDAGVGQFTLWGWKPGEVAQAKAQAASGNVEALQKVQGAMARHKRLFVDLGLQEPESWAKGPNSIVGRLGELRGCECTLVVQPDRKKPERDKVFINAPARDPLEGAAHHPGGGLDLPSFDGSDSMGDVPLPDL